MSIEVVPYTREWIDAVHEFNLRMEAGGTHWRWYEDPVDGWVPPGEGQRTWREHYLAVEDGELVRGGYALKPHEFLLRGELRIVADWQGPITEGILSRRYNTLGIRLMREMLKQYPLLYSWGHGGLEQPMLEMLRRLGWLLHGTPACLYVRRPARFLHRNGYLRSTPARRLAQDLLAATGLGWLSIHALHAALRLRGGWPAAGEVETFQRFEAWADELWERVRGEYSLIAARDAATMNLLLQEGKWPPGIKLRVRRGDEILGWAVVLDTRQSRDRRFGDLHLGSVVDALASPEDAVAVAGAAHRFLCARGADVILSNQAHPAWQRAFASHGYLLLPERRVFAVSPPLKAALDPLEESLAGIHLTNMDGHGPMRL